MQFIAQWGIYAYPRDFPNPNTLQERTTEIRQRQRACSQGARHEIGQSRPQHGDAERRQIRLWSVYAEMGGMVGGSKLPASGRRALFQPTLPKRI